MKFVVLGILLLGASAFADSNCGALQSVNGNYVQVSDSCQNDSGWTGYKYIEVTSAQVRCEDGQNCVQTWILHTFAGRGTGGVGVGPTSQANDRYVCTTSAAGISVRDYVGPTYAFSNGQLTYAAGFCTATFKKAD